MKPRYALCAILICASGCETYAGKVEEAGFRPIPLQVDLGVIPRGGSRQLVVRAHNGGGAEVSVLEWRTSCDCVRIAPSETQIGPNQSRYVMVTASFAHDPDYGGDLNVECRGYDRAGQVVVEGSVNISVVDPAALADLSPSES